MTPDIILDAHEFHVDTTLQAQWGGGSESSIAMSRTRAQ